MDNCIDCKVGQTKNNLLCGWCDDNLKTKIKKHIRNNCNRPRNENISRQKLRYHN